MDSELGGPVGGEGWEVDGEEVVEGDEWDCVEDGGDGSASSLRRA